MVSTLAARTTLGLALLLFSLTACADAPALHDQHGTARTAQTETIRAEIWQKELMIYTARGRGDLDTYIANASAQYRGWPPSWAKPSGLDALRSDAAKMKSMNQELLEMTQEDFALSGDTAVIYYSTHRTRLPTGEAVDQRFDIAHIWVRENGQWRLLGAMARGKIKS